MTSTRLRDIDEVFRAAPAEFVRTRNAVADRLRKSGRAKEAADVAKLRKPSPALWAVNQVAHEKPGEVGAFLAAIEQLRRAQLGRVTDAARQATARQRNVLDNVVTLATEILSRAHLATTPAVLRRVSSTLLGAAADTDARERLRHGQLTGEYGAPGFEAFSGVTPGARPEPPRAVKRDGGEHETALRRHSREQQRAVEREARAREREHRAAVARAAKLEREAVRLRQRAKQTEQGVERLRQRLREAEERVARERRTADEAETSARRARERVREGSAK